MSEIFKGLEFRSTISATGELRLSLEQVTLAPPAAGEVIVQIEAAPLNPSDLGLMFGPADLSTMQVQVTTGQPAITATVHEHHLGALKKRLDLSLPVGNEGAGTVVAAGEGAQHLLGREVAAIPGGMYAQYRKLRADECTVLPPDTTAAEAAAMFVNPLTALGFVETMRREGYSALVHTAAASNLGQMLVKICQADGIPLVNIVRSQQQVELLRGIGATYVLDSSAPDFKARLVDAVAETGATLGFDAVGGKLAGQILTAMEAAIDRKTIEYSRYGSAVPKQVYVYGMLDVGPIILERGFGFTWGVGGWLLWPALQRLGSETAERMRQRVLAELKTTFASHYTRTIGLRDLLKTDIIEAAQRKSTGEKFLIDPMLDA